MSIELMEELDRWRIVWVGEINGGELNPLHHCVAMLGDLSSKMSAWLSVMPEWTMQ